MNSRYNLVHDVFYGYYRQGLDNMYENETLARTNMLSALSQLQTINQENPGIMLIPFIMAGKAQELIKIFKKAPPADKSRAIELLQKLDIPNAAKYQQELK